MFVAPPLPLASMIRSAWRAVEPREAPVDEDKTGARGWYVRRGLEVKGPYPAGLVSRHVLLGRIRSGDQLSQDGMNWRPLADCPELLPPVLDAPAEDTQAQERLAAARRWADERGVHGVLEAHERRHAEPGEAAPGHAPEATRNPPLGAEERYPRAFYLPLGIMLIVAALVIFMVYEAPELRDSGQQTARCAALPAPGVDWTSCHMAGVSLHGAVLAEATLKGAILWGADLREAQLQGADFAYAQLGGTRLAGADMRRVRLVGAGLRNADLSGAQLQGADLSYADLFGARLQGANLDGASLDHAIWPDGRVCARGSRGTCESPQARP